MEELRSTDILDREIQDDARRKAEKVLKAGENECAQIAEGVQTRVEAVILEKKAEYEKRLAAYRRDSESAIPLEKQRRLVSFIDASVNEALDVWFADIGPTKRLSLFARLLERYKTVLSDARINAVFTGYSVSEMQEMLAGIFGIGRIASVTELTPAQVAKTGFPDGLNIESTDRKILCRATLDEIRLDLLSNRRQELAEALLGGRLGE